ncbi:primosomal protein N' [Eggerthellaceae bacterium zg-1084]|uniref:replication restart helicase PriA n=1 Tax=Berryella wangjianweii TaxID=2734634 RepID=UPI001551A3E1|nr:primosomal protein N' [Berryella wangjianweii]NPD31510.1 primosomal protein N' [Berryella wangjianweii]
MKIARVVLDISTHALDAPYTYRAPDEVPDTAEYELEVGCAVLVPFGPRSAVGFVVAIEEVSARELSAELDPAKLRYVSRVLSPAYFDEEGAACARWLAESCLAPLSACVRLFTPPGGVPRMVRGPQGWRLQQSAVGEVDDRWVMLDAGAADFTPRRNAVRQAAIIEALRAGELRVSELTVEFGSVSSVLRALEQKGVVRIERRRRFRGMQGPVLASRTSSAPGAIAAEGAGAHAAAVPAAAIAPDAAAHAAATPAAPEPDACFTPSPKPRLTQGQAAALEAIRLVCDRGAGEAVLLDGVTGSGKTEVYLQAIEHVLDQGRNAVVLVPEIALTPQTVGRFRGRFGDRVAVMHSRMSAGERYDQWDFIYAGQARVVVGARSALFTPMREVGIIIIDEEHEATYKQESAPRYHAREVALWMAARSGAGVVLGSATPSIESLHAAATNPRWQRVALPERANGRPLPPVTVIDMAREFGSGSRSMFSRTLAQSLHDELAAGRKAVLLLNQRGFAKFVLCRECGHVPTCPDCSTSLTFHEQGSYLCCHHCGHRIAAPARCPECSSPYLRKFGAGTQRVEADLRVLIEGFGLRHEVPIIRMDADTTSGKNAHQTLLERFGAASSAVLLGTQMIAKGLDFDDVTLVGVINADTMLMLPDYRSAERTYSLIEQVAGRAGRAHLDGRVLVQTYEAAASAIRAAAAHDRAIFLRDELPKRRALSYPPYARLANVLVWGQSLQDVSDEAKALRAVVERRVRDWVGPFGWKVQDAVPCALAKLRGTHRWHFVVKAPAGTDMSPVLLPVFRERRPRAGVSVAVDIDPLDML